MFCISTYIEKHAREIPRNTAITFNERTISYSELETRIRLMAGALARRNVSSGDVVAIMCERNVELIVAIVAVLRLGGIYLPIDKLNPKPRLEYILSNSNAKLIIADQTIQVGDQWPQIPLDILTQDDGGSLDEKRYNDGFCIMYTSGTTGRPKGTLMHRKGVFNHLQSKIDCVSISQNSVVAQSAGYYFVNSIWQIFSTLIVGAHMVIYDRYIMNSTQQLICKMQKDQVQIFQVVPTLLERMLEYTAQNQLLLPALKCIVSSSEKLTFPLVEKHFNVLPDVRLVNAYGMTECSDDVLHYAMSTQLAEQDIPIGLPVPNTRIYIVGKQNEVCDTNQRGEICVAGIGLSEGYLNAPEQTDLAFVRGACFGLDEVCLYRTGDIGYRREDGNYVYLGRKDYQIKIGGFRVELYEIEDTLLKHPDITQTAVICVEESDKKIMVAFYMSEHVIVPENIISFLRGLLPGYMIPVHFIHMQQFPLTAMEKIDRKKLYEYVSLEQNL